MLGRQALRQLAMRPLAAAAAVVTARSNAPRLACDAAHRACWTLARVGLPQPSLLQARSSLVRPAPLLQGQMPVSGFLQQQQRGLKTLKRQIKRRYRDPPKYKMKRKKAMAARFKIVGNDKVKYWRAGRVHNSSGKTKKRLRLLRRPGYAVGPRRKTILRGLLGYN
ncbi:uncharacterized protein MONBRDRAFT_39094 [Monosiga brevicollis MX1]|uniref:50S ribosomal protein L35 n=1 Tax=Monosiga brevicollis TaxID=81824 RepID=A9VC55_MONBE|nr:uncharacterized protein MONBRDRAFT_39094 [Monosiga brevicollis MX1]EDQ84924.1 predicted protein [Monosiga brevicollis MX1]|eukprot:XP_001750265.1 hypothetical protein [Monosiga brevicollis MX1]